MQNTAQQKMSSPPKKKNPWTPMAAGCIAGKPLEIVEALQYHLLETS